MANPVAPLAVYSNLARNNRRPNNRFNRRSRSHSSLDNLLSSSQRLRTDSRLLSNLLHQGLSQTTARRTTVVLSATSCYLAAATV